MFLQLLANKHHRLRDFKASITIWPSGGLRLVTDKKKRRKIIINPMQSKNRARPMAARLIIGIMQGKVCLAALPIPEYLDFHSGYSAPRSRIGGINSRIYSYSRIFPNEHALSFNCVRVQRRTGIFGYFFLKDIVFSL